MTTLLTQQPERTAEVKVVLLGETSVGKSSILERLQNNTFSDAKSSTIGAAFVSKKVLRDNDLVNLQIWDTAGQERFHNLTPLYYRNANVALIIFDLTSKASFSKAQYWINELQSYSNGDRGAEENEEADETGKIEIILVGNKLDLLGFKENSNTVINDDENGYNPTVDMYNECTFTDEVQEFMVSHGIGNLFKASAKDNVQINELFQYIVDNVKDAAFHIDEESEGMDYSKNRILNLRLGRRSQEGGTNACQC